MTYVQLTAFNKNVYYNTFSFNFQSSVWEHYIPFALKVIIFKYIISIISTLYRKRVDFFHKGKTTVSRDFLISPKNSLLTAVSS